MAKKHFRCDYSKYQSEPFWNAVCIPSTKGRHILIDIDDYQRIIKSSWYCVKGQSCDYAVSEIKGKSIPMHRLLLNCPKDKVVDHINGNTFDNRKSNLRICTQSQNSMNSVSKGRGSSKYKGVMWRKNRKCWIAYAYVNRKIYIMGSFKEEIEAVNYYNNNIKNIHGEFAKLNVIQKES